MAPLTLLSLGSINADFQVRVDQPVGSRETLLAHDFCRFSGGKAANTAFLATRLGQRSRLFGRVGDDALAEQALAPLREAGVMLDGVQRAVGQPTGVSLIMVPPDAKKHIVLATNANDQWDAAALAQLEAALSAIETPACLVLDCEVPAAAVRRAIEAVRRQGIPVVLDPSFPDRVEPDLLPALAAILPNADEAAQLVGAAVDSVPEALAAARRLHGRGAALAGVKLGDGGCVLVGEAGAWHLPGGAVDPVDTTGAGDAFSGAFAVALLEGRPPLEAASWGVAASQHAVTGYGSQPAYPGRDVLLAQAGQVLAQARRLA